MTIPINPVSLPAPAGPPEQSFLQLLMQGANFSQRAQELELEKKRIKVLQAQQQFEESKFSQEQAQLRSMQPALLALLTGDQPQQSVQIPSLPTAGAGIGQTLPMTIQAPTDPVSAGLRRAAPEALPQLVQLARPEIDARREAQMAAARARSVEGVVQGLPDDIREQARQYLTLELGGTKIAADVLPTMFPKLVPQGIDPRTVTNASGIFRGSDGVFTYGDAALLADPTGQYYHSIPAELRDRRMVPILGGAGNEKQTELQSRMGVFHLQLLAGTAGIKDLVNRGVRPSYRGDLARDLMTQSRGGGVFDLAVTLTNKFNYATLPDEQKELINHSLQVGDAFRRIMSGQQSTDREFAFTMGYIVPTWGDNEVLVRKKLLFMDMMQSAAEAAANGTRLGSEAVAALVDDAVQMDMPPEMIRELRQLQTRAQEYEAMGRPAVPSRYPTDPNDPGAMETRLRGLLEEYDRRNAARARRAGP